MGGNSLSVLHSSPTKGDNSCQGKGYDYSGVASHVKHNLTLHQVVYLQDVLLYFIYS